MSPEAGAPDTPNAPPNAKELALRRLSLREYSSAELLGYLRRKGVPEDEAREAVRELEERGLIDPARYGAAIARSQIARGKGPMAVLAKLRRRGLSADLSDARRLYLAEAGEAEAIRKVLATRFPDLDPGDRVAVAKAYQALLRRGFSPAEIRQVLKGVVLEDSGDL